MSVLTATHVISGFTFEEIGRNGHGRITAKIYGYWSSDPITLYIDRKNSWNSNGENSFKWVATMSHSSGGRETKEVECDMEAELNFAEAIRALAYLGRDIINQHTDTMEQAYQAERARQRELLEAEKAAKAAALEADPALGYYRAEAKIENLINTGNSFSVYKRGSTSNNVYFTIERRAKTRIYMNHKAVSRKTAIVELSNLSKREYSLAA